MTSNTTKPAADAGRLDQRVGRLVEIRAYLAAEADFNRSWTDGRRMALGSTNPAYIARRIEIAEQCEAWCSALDDVLRELA